jgi:hypothetical protein
MIWHVPLARILHWQIAVQSQLLSFGSAPNLIRS